jgi:hypothetical protein
LVFGEVIEIFMTNMVMAHKKLEDVIYTVGGVL